MQSPPSASTRPSASNNSDGTVSRPTTQPAKPVQSDALENQDDTLDSLLTLSQEQLILQESNFNIQNATSSSVQHFHFHGPISFYDVSK